jgi:hypothetical protein
VRERLREVAEKALAHGVVFLATGAVGPLSRAGSCLDDGRR